MTDTLLVIDVQAALLDELAPGRSDELLVALGAALQRARAAAIPVVYVRHDGSPHELLPETPAWQIAAPIAPHAGDAIVEKRQPDAFRDTDLEDVLERLGSEHLIIGGMQTDVCVNATIHGAVERGYRVTLLEDAHATSGSGETNEAAIRVAMHARVAELGVSFATATSFV